MLRRKKVLVTVSVLALCVLMTASCVSSNASQVNEKYDNPFLDVKDSDWFGEDVQYVTENGLISGISDASFAPNDTTTRGMLVTILWRLDGKPKANKDNAFTDVEKDKYYYTAVSWASENNIVSGYSQTQFAPNDNMTREQLAAVLYRYANYKKYDVSGKVDLSSYKDIKQISDYAIDAFKWANVNGIITGTSSDTLDPKGNAQRAQIASILHRFCDKYIEAKEYSDKATATPLPSPTPAFNGNENETEKKEATSESTSVNNDITSNDSDPNKNAYTNSQNNEEVNHLENTNSNKEDEQINYDTETMVEDDGLPLIIGRSVNASPGDSIQVYVDIKNNPGILGMVLTVNFDEANFTLESAESGDAFHNALEFTTSQKLYSGSRFIWDGVEISPEDIRDGSILVLNFRVADSVRSGRYPITLSYSEGDIVDNDLSSVPMNIETGYIIVN